MRPSGIVRSTGRGKGRIIYASLASICLLACLFALALWHDGTDLESRERATDSVGSETVGQKADADEPRDGNETIQDALGVPDVPEAQPVSSIESLRSRQGTNTQVRLHPSLNAYVAPSPYGSNAAKVGNEETESPVPSTRAGLSAASDTVGGTVAWQELSRAIRTIEKDGHQVGISVASMSGEVILAYNQDAEMYPASAIKGPYVIAVWREGASQSGSLVDWSESILGWSDNDSYHSMRDTYGDGPIRRLAQECGLDMSRYDGNAWAWAQWYYPRTSPHDMTRMWLGLTPYLLDMGSDGAAKLRQMMTEREVSPIRDGLPLAATTYGKAGWLSEYGDYGATPAAVDAGMVLWPDGRAYVVTIMTDTEEDMEAVSVLAACVDRVHYAMLNPK